MQAIDTSSGRTIKEGECIDAGCCFDRRSPTEVAGGVTCFQKTPVSEKTEYEKKTGHVWEGKVQPDATFGDPYTLPKKGNEWFRTWQIQEGARDRRDTLYPDPTLKLPPPKQDRFVDQLWAGKYHDLFPDEKWLPGGKVELDRTALSKGDLSSAKLKPGDDVRRRRLI